MYFGSKKVDKGLTKLFKRSFSVTSCCWIKFPTRSQGFMKTKIEIDQYSDIDSLKQVTKSQLTNTLSTIDAAMLDFRTPTGEICEPDEIIKSFSDFGFGSYSNALELIIPEAEEEIIIEPIWNAFHISRPDKSSSNYLKSNLPLPQTFEELTTYLSNETIKFPVWNSHLNQFKNDPYWHEIVSQSSVCIAKREDACEDLVHAIYKMMSDESRTTKNFVTEDAVIPLVDTCMLIPQLSLGLKASHNKGSSSSDGGRPDYQLENKNCAILFGENKMKLRAENGDDPVLQLESRVRWNDWESFYGNAPYIFGFTTIASYDRVDFNFGILDRQSQSFISLQTTNLLDSYEVADYCEFMIKLAPIMNHINEMTLNHQKRY